MISRRNAAQWVTRCITAAMLSMAMAAAGVYAFGPPPFVARRIIAEMAQRGFVVRLRRLHLRLPFDLEARGVRVYAGDVADAPVLEADRAILHLDPRGAWRGAGWLRGARLTGGRLWFGTSDDSAPFRSTPTEIIGIEANIEFAPDGLWVHHAEARFGAIWRASGHIAVSGSGYEAGRLPAGWDQKLRALARPMGEAARALTALHVSDPPLVHVAFRFWPNDPIRNEFTLAVRGARARPGGLPPSTWRLRTMFRDGEWRIEQADVAWDRGQLALRGAIQPATRRIEFRASGTMPSRDWLKLPLPASVRRRLEQWDVVASRLRIEAATDGLVSLDEPARRLFGHFEVIEGEILDVPISRLSADFRAEEARVRLENVEGRLGVGPRGGPLQGWVELDFETGRFEGRMRTGFDPSLLLPLLTERQAAAVAAVVFLDSPPRIEAEFSGRVGSDESLRIRGRIEGDRFVYNGSAVLHAEADVEAEEETLRLRNVLIERAEGRLTGRMDQHHARREVQFEVESTLHPPALARMISPFTHRLLQQFRFEGPVRIVGQGQATYDGRNDHDFRLAVEGERMGHRWLLADRLAFDVEAVGRVIALRNIRGDWHGGVVSGEVEIELTEPKEEPVRYRARGRIENADLGGIARAAADMDAVPYSGRITLEGQFSGALGEGYGRETTGAGTVRIRNGYLMKIPLFGPLSRGLSRLYAGLGFAAQDEFKARWTLADGVLRTSDAQLRGPTISLRARGRYDLKDDLQLIVEVQLLRSGLIADAVRLLTLPITRLMEFEVTGPIEHPRWIPRNLPRAMVDLFSE